MTKQFYETSSFMIDDNNSFIVTHSNMDSEHHDEKH
jgi:hypothetical protein